MRFNLRLVVGRFHTIYALPLWNIVFYPEKKIIFFVLFAGKLFLTVCISSAPQREKSFHSNNNCTVIFVEIHFKLCASYFCSILFILLYLVWFGFACKKFCENLWPSKLEVLFQIYYYGSVILEGNFDFSFIIGWLTYAECRKMDSVCLLNVIIFVFIWSNQDFYSFFRYSLKNGLFSVF